MKGRTIILFLTSAVMPTELNGTLFQIFPETPSNCRKLSLMERQNPGKRILIPRQIKTVSLGTTHSHPMVKKEGILVSLEDTVISLHIPAIT